MPLTSNYAREGISTYLCVPESCLCAAYFLSPRFKYTAQLLLTPPMDSEVHGILEPFEHADIWLSKPQTPIRYAAVRSNHMYRITRKTSKLIQKMLNNMIITCTTLGMWATRTLPVALISVRRILRRGYRLRHRRPGRIRIGNLQED